MGVSWDVEWVEETGSTNADLLAAARGGAAEGRVLVADHQSAGKGRLGRTWVAPPSAALLFSVLVRPTIPLAQAHLVTTALALAAADACGSEAGVAPELKWPNDLLVDGRKLGGVLAESIVEGDVLEALVVGMGLNVAFPDPLPADIADIATALDRAGGRPVERRRLLDVILEGFAGRYAALLSGGVEALVDEARRRTATLGQVVRVDLGGEQFVGEAVDLTLAGHLVVEVGGLRREVTAGDVVHVRPHA